LSMGEIKLGGGSFDGVFAGYIWIKLLVFKSLYFISSPEILYNWLNRPSEIVQFSGIMKDIGVNLIDEFHLVRNEY
jgi:hypothetical protein